jgi:hypothetical protein
LRGPAATSNEGSSLSLVPLVVRGRPMEPDGPSLRVELPDGTRVHASGLSAGEVVQAIQAFGRCR